MERYHVCPIGRFLLSLTLSFGFATSSAVSAQEGAADGSVTGEFIANGEAVSLPYVYVWAEDEGFYDPGDPTWTILFVGRKLGQREIGDMVWDAAWVEIGVTQTAEFSGESEVQVYTQSIRFSADAGGNTSGGDYPEVKLQGLGTDRISGRVWHNEAQTSFDDSYFYDLTFEAVLTDPDAPIGDVLPAGGGKPGEAYVTWVETLHTADIEALKKIVPPELAEQLDSVSPQEAREEVEFMKSMTPTNVSIVGGSSDGDVAVLDVEGDMAGERGDWEITMTRMGEFWVPTGSESKSVLGTIPGESFAENLNEAILFNDPVAVRAQLDQGANPNEVVNNRTHLGWAAQNADAEIVEILLAAGADPNAEDSIGQTPLMRAVESGRRDNAGLLIAAGADVNHATSEGRTLGIMAVESDDVALVRALLDAGANFEATNDYGDFALMVAVRNGGPNQTDIISALAEAGVNMDQSDSAYTALFYAVEQGDMPLVQALLAAGASADAKTSDGGAPLIKAIYHPEIFAALLDAGADPDISGKWGDRVIFEVLNHGSADDLRKLLDAGAEADFTTDDGRTPLDRAEFSGKEDMVAVLREYGAGAQAEPEVAGQPAELAGGSHWLATVPAIEPVEAPTRFTPSMTYESNARLRDVLAHYDSHLGSIGWARDGLTSDYDSYTAAEYKRGDELLSMSLTTNPADPAAKVTVSLTPLGTVSTSALPRYPGSEVLFESPLTSMYVTSDEVGLVARETLNLLQGDGWQGGFVVEREDDYLIEVSRSGTKLNVSIGVAAGQGGRTSIQYVALKDDRHP